MLPLHSASNLFSHNQQDNVPDKAKSSCDRWLWRCSRFLGRHLAGTEVDDLLCCGIADPLPGKVKKAVGLLFRNVCIRYGFHSLRTRWESGIQ